MWGIGSGGITFSFAVAVLFASNFRSAVLKPLFLVMLVTRYHSLIKDQEINSLYADQLSAASDLFGELREKAQAFGRELIGAPDAG